MLDVPWIDRPDALDELSRARRSGRLDEDTSALIEHYIRDGYCVVRDVVDPKLVDGMVREVEELWTTSRPIDGLELLDVRVDPNRPVNLPHRELVKLPREERDAIKLRSRWRLHGFHRFSPFGMKIFRNARLRALATALLGRQAEPQATINFAYGSEQKLHQDMGVFHVVPRNFLLGAWLACEDIHPDSGPLVYYRGSHRSPFFPEFDPGYPQTNLRTCEPPAIERYHLYMEREAARYEKQSFVAKKGEVLLWHGMLIHGGDPIARPELTRHSYVCHYMPDGVNRHDEIRGPFNW